MPLVREERAATADRFFDGALLAMLLSGFFGMASSGELDPVTLGLTAAAFAFRLALLALRKRLDVSAVAINLAVIAYLGFAPVDYFFLSQDFFGATVRMICFLAVVKGLTVVTDRDALYAVLIAFAELLAAALLSSGLLFFVFLALFVFAGVATFASWQIRLGAQYAAYVAPLPELRFGPRLIGTTVVAGAGILVFTVAMFFILPRTARAALQGLVHSRYHLPGFSGQVRLGEIGDIQTSSRTIFHIRMDGSAPETLPYKWRGTALDDFDGRQWIAHATHRDFIRGTGPIPNATRGALHRTGRRIRYHVQLSENGLHTLFVAPTAEFLESNLGVIEVLSNGAISTFGDAPSMLRYSASSFIDASNGDHSPSPSPQERDQLLALPNVDPRIPRLAREITTADAPPLRKARQIEGWLQSHLGYTLEQPSTPPADPVAHFLFERRRGHCEYFASSMAVLLRTLGIPTRVVTGFQGGVRNPVSGWHVVRASDAHSWVEAWFPETGWTTFDPTPASPVAASRPLFERLSHLLDAADLFWQEWVIQYDLERQFRLAMHLDQVRSAGRRQNSWMDAWPPSKETLRTVFLHWGLPLLGVLLLGFAGRQLTPVVRRRLEESRRRRRLAAGQASAHDAAQLYRRLLDLLESRGVRKPGWYTPREFVAVLPASETNHLVGRFTDAYYRFRFGHDPAAGVQMLEIYDAVLQADSRPAPRA